MKSHFTLMARYNAWANARLYGAALKLPDEAFRRNVGAFFGSLHGTLNHLLLADRIWMRRFTGTGDHPANLDAILFDDLAGLTEARKAEDERIIAYVGALPEAKIGEVLHYVNTHGAPFSNPRGDILAHMFNHQTHHRGQAHTILSLLGVTEPPPLDLMAMLRE